MHVRRRHVTQPHPCAYLPQQTATLEYLQIPGLTAADYEQLMNQGLRKFGALAFRPICAGCRECRPIRILVEQFRPDRSQRRAWKRIADLRVERARPSADAQRLELYRRYHDAQTDEKEWPRHKTDFEEYLHSFVLNPVPAVEVTLWDDARLLAVLLTEVTPNVVSGIYHFYDPDYRDRSLGTCCMLHTIELARVLEKPYAYFGYYVEGCASLRYKARFQPCEVMDPDGNWTPLAFPRTSSDEPA
jgi:arginine-tRNA-protein transferase